MSFANQGVAKPRLETGSLNLRHSTFPPWLRLPGCSRLSLQLSLARLENLVMGKVYFVPRKTATGLRFSWNTRHMAYSGYVKEHSATWIDSQRLDLGR